MKARWTIVVAFILIALPVTLHAQMQTAKDKVFAAIPEQSRTQLIERINLYVTSQRIADYDKLFDLFTEKTINEIFKGQSKAEFIAEYRKGDEERKSVRLLEFTPMRIEKVAEPGAEFYRIYGKATVLQQDEIIKKEVLIEAYPQNGNWYFSAVATVENDYGL